MSGGGAPKPEVVYQALSRGALERLRSIDAGNGLALTDMDFVLERFHLLFIYGVRPALTILGEQVARMKRPA